MSMVYAFCTDVVTLTTRASSHYTALLRASNPPQELKHSRLSPDMSSCSDEAYFTPKNSPAAEQAEPHTDAIETGLAPNTIHEYPRVEGDQQLGSPSDPAPGYYPIYILNFATAMTPETYPSTVLFNRSPIPGPTHAEITPRGPSFLMEASMFQGNERPLPENAAEFGLWLVEQPGRKIIIPNGSWVFFPIRGGTP